MVRGEGSEAASYRCGKMFEVLHVYHQPMSALPPKADIRGYVWNVR